VANSSRRDGRLTRLAAAYPRRSPAMGRWGPPHDPWARDPIVIDEKLEEKLDGTFGMMASPPPTGKWHVGDVRPQPLFAKYAADGTPMVPYGTSEGTKGTGIAVRGMCAPWRRARLEAAQGKDKGMNPHQIARDSRYERGECCPTPCIAGGSSLRYGRWYAAAAASHSYVAAVVHTVGHPSGWVRTGRCGCLRTVHFMRAEQLALAIPCLTERTPPSHKIRHAYLPCASHGSGVSISQKGRSCQRCQVHAHSREATKF
jgi:hypothetical protein